MTFEQFQGLTREIIFALLALLVSFNLFPETSVDVVAAAVIGLVVLIWGLGSKNSDRSAIASLVRKALQAIPPVLVQFELLTTEQGATMTALALAVVGAWSFKANSPS